MHVVNELPMGTCALAALYEKLTNAKQYTVLSTSSPPCWLCAVDILLHFLIDWISGVACQVRNERSIVAGGRGGAG